MTCMPNAHIKGYLSQIFCNSNNVLEEKWLVKLWNGKAFLLDFRVFRIIGSKPRHCIIKFSLQSSDTFNISHDLSQSGLNLVFQFLLCHYPYTIMLQQNHNLPLFEYLPQSSPLTCSHWFFCLEHFFLTN